MVTDVGRGWISHIACRTELRAVAPLRLSLSRRYSHVGVVRRTYVTDVRTERCTRGSGSPARTASDTHRTGHGPTPPRAHDRR